jgi:hypothetical protein
MEEPFPAGLPLESILKKCKAEGRRFVDGDFPPTDEFVQRRMPSTHFPFHRVTIYVLTRVVMQVPSGSDPINSLVNQSLFPIKPQQNLSRVGWPTVGF